ncbi:hypothetical protein MCG98_11940 [Ruminococcus sp. OA3]|uniref:hypothetical protein n=1 Tax=Ruminococcus sp. OA3 TaxID=2914164 RepID=UPI001F06BDF7|nr:hypothetical protein [Ruminococcus sp. OA3]MCH1983274.1 hypothetical protein [Ruminococcus sp. OA3]
MKKLLASGAAAALVFTTVTVTFAAGADTLISHAVYCETNGYHCGHVTDEDPDGLCDSCQDHTSHDRIHSYHHSENEDLSRHGHGRHHN